MRSGCDSATIRREVDDTSVEITAVPVKSYDVGGVGIPHVGGILWPQFDGYGIELRLRVDDRPPFAVATPAPDPATAPEEDALQAAAEALELSAAPGGDHLAFRKKATDGWTVVHLLPQGVPFRSRHSESIGPHPDWSALPSPESIALDALTSTKPERSVLEAVQAQTSPQPWDSALLAAWQPRSAVHATLVARLEARDEIDPTFVDEAARTALPHVAAGGRTVRAAVDLLLALKNEAWIAEMDEQLLQALPDPHATSILKRRIAPIRTVGRAHPPTADLKQRARTALEGQVLEQ